MSVQVDQQSNIKIIEQVTALPLVKSAIGLATDSYEKIKGSNQLLGSTMSAAEQSVRNVANYVVSHPVTAKLEGPISMADSIACQGFEKLVEKVPAIKQSPEELYTTGLEKVGEMRKYGEDKVQGLKEYGMSKVEHALANPYAQAVAKIVDSAVDLTDKTVDHYLPPDEEEQQSSNAGQNGGESQNVVQKVGTLSNKMRRRVLRQASNSFQSIQKRSQEALDQMKYTVDLIQYAKTMEESGRQKLSESVSNLSAGAKHLWEELNKEEAEAESESKTVDQQLLSVARRATKRVVETYHQLSGLTDLLPENVRASMEASSAYAKDVLHQLSSVSSVKDLSDIAVKQMVIGAETVQSMMNKTLSPIMPTISWVTPTDGTSQQAAAEGSGSQSEPTQPKVQPPQPQQPQPQQQQQKPQKPPTPTKPKQAKQQKPSE